MANARIRLRGDTAANWTALDPVLAEREVGLETDTRKMKIGDGVTAWSGLGYTASDAAPVPDGDKGDINVSGGGATWGIKSSVLSTYGRTLTDDPDAPTARATLGLGDIATEAATTFISKAEGAADTGTTLIKHKRSGTGTYARSTAELERLGGAGDDNIMHWIDPAHDDDLVGGTNAADLTAQITNAIADKKAENLSSGRRQRLFAPALTFRHESALLFDCSGLVVDGHGAIFEYPFDDFIPAHGMTGDDQEYHGVQFLQSGTAAATCYTNIGATNCRFYGVQNLRPNANSSIPIYVRSDGFEWRGGKMDAYGGINVMSASHGVIDGVIMTQSDAFAGVDDNIALKSTTAQCVDWRISNLRVRNKANCVGIGSQVGMQGAADPNYTYGVYGVLVENIEMERCSSAIAIKPGAINPSDTPGDSYDFRDGITEGIVANNITMRDLTGVRMGKPVWIQAGRGQIIRGVKITNLYAEGRHLADGSTRAGLALIYFVDVDAIMPGTAQTNFSDIYIQGSYLDPYAGAAAGGQLPARPLLTSFTSESRQPVPA